MDIAKTFTLYKLSDTAFTLSDSRASRTLDAFGKMAYSATNKETVWVLEEYDRRHGKPKIIFDTALRYYRASEVKDKVSGITKPVDELYRYLLTIRPLESLHTADKRKISSAIKLKDVWAVRETYWDNVLFNMRCLESLKVLEIKRNGTALGTKKESFTLKDDEKKQFTKKQCYSLRIGDKNSKRLTISKHELTKLTEAYRRANKWKRAANEMVLLVDKEKSQTRKETAEDIAVKERPVKAVFINPWEAVIIVDDAMAFFNWFRTVQETLSIAEYHNKLIHATRPESLRITLTLPKKLSRAFQETITAIERYMSHAQPKYDEMAVTFTDGENKALEVVRSEMIHTTEIYWDNVLFLIHISEDIRTTEAVKKTAVKQLDDAFSFMDSLRKASRLNRGENLAVIEKERQTIEHELYDGLHIMDEWRNDMRTLAREQVKAMDHIAKHATLAQFDEFYVRDDYKKIWQTVQTFREELKTLDKVYRNIYAVRDDRIAIADKRLVKLERTLHESIDTDESFNRNVAFVRGLAELARIGDGLTRDIGKNPAEDIALYDAYVRASNSYIESVQVVSSFKEMDDFAAMADTPPMYEQFTDFNVGDYEYEKALLRLRVVSKATQAQPLLYDVSPHVDIDDTDDKGQLEIKDTTAATKVYYNKHYYNAPEVNAMVKGGTGATTPVPNILTTDGQDDKGRYFEIELLNSSGNRTTGIVSWVAKGW
ncbi:hypothetical protein [Megasphaera elsdenii]|uniref:Uncharacterized protein n=1 Tax=Megasphaera elsdenii TaxID=907 RepID=A0A2S0M9C8_MEGEL|nr:hypothetical protein [Megasphaera elsdenii]AVO28080.1 hypothetical protein C6Y28_10820 [Megasphaera elsdenii]